jgi:hypothetical protein
MSAETAETAESRPDESDATPRSRLGAAIRALSGIGDYAVDIAGITALAALGFSPASEATLQILAGAIASVALGKRYLSKPS